MNHRISSFLALVLALTACGSGSVTDTTTPPSTSSGVAETTVPPEAVSTTVGMDRVTAWEEDIETLGERVRLLHPNPFWRADEAQFDADLAALQTAVPELTDEQVILELVKLVARIDGHTGLSMSQETVGFGRYQIRFYQFDDGLFVVESPQSDLVGGRLVSVNGVPIDEVLEVVSPYAQWDNFQTVKNLRPLFLVNPTVLMGEGVIDDAGSPAFEIELVDGTTTTVSPLVLHPARWGEWAEHPVLPLARPDLELETRSTETIWWEAIEDGSTIYVQYNLVNNLGDTVAEMEEHLAATDVTKIIVDLRRNPGGNNTTFGALRRFIDDADEAGIEIVMITSRQTFSAAANFATYVDVETDAIFVGEGMGGSPNLYGDTRTARLPNSGIEVRISARYWEIGGPDDTRETIEPDIPVAVTSDDYFGGLDPVLEAALDA